MAEVHRKHHRGTSLGFSSAEAGAASKGSKAGVGVLSKGSAKGTWSGVLGEVSSKSQAAAYPLGLFQQMGPKVQAIFNFLICRRS